MITGITAIGIVPPHLDPDVPRIMCEDDYCPKVPERDWDSIDPGLDPNDRPGV
jgi:hypothetical protein